MMTIVQSSIQWLEVSGGRRVLKKILAVLILAGFAVLFNFRCFRNMQAPEAMDAAQLARNVSEGRGYTTSFIRPFSMYLQKEQNELAHGALGRVSELTKIKDRHPDISNPPAYPIFLAGLMKILPFRFTLPARSQTFFNPGGRFTRYEPDFLIALINEVLFCVVVVLMFFLARRLFDSTTAWVSATLLYFSDLLWRFSMSGLSTMLLLLIFTGLVWCLLWIEREGSEEQRGMGPFLALCGATGALAGLGALTRYAFAWMIIPVILFLARAGGRRRIAAAATALAAFAVVFGPWVGRNYSVSGTPFGTAGYAVYEGTFLFPENSLERSLAPDLTGSTTTAFGQKLFSNARHILADELPTIGGGWVGAFFLIGLMASFGRSAPGRLRAFLVLAMAIFVIVEALGRTHLSDMTPEINSENLMILFAPLILVYGVNFFFLLLNQLALPIGELRYLIIALFCLATCYPIIFHLLPPREHPVVFPPYYPPAIQASGTFLRPNELMMSDMPWAQAWYADCQALWLTPGPQGFYDIHDFQKPIEALFLSQPTMDQPFLSNLTHPQSAGWSALLLQAAGSVAAGDNGASGALSWPRQVKLAAPGRTGEKPSPFPLHYLQPGWPSFALLTERPAPVGKP